MALYVAGGMGIVIALIHGWLGETKLIAPVTFPSRMAKNIMRAIFQLSTAIWIAGSAVLIATPAYVPDSHRAWVVAVATAPMLWCVFGNFWASRGRHFGWMALSVVLAIAAYGALGPA